MSKIGGYFKTDFCLPHHLGDLVTTWIFPTTGLPFIWRSSLSACKEKLLNVSLPKKSTFKGCAGRETSPEMRLHRNRVRIGGILLVSIRGNRCQSLDTVVSCFPS